MDLAALSWLFSCDNRNRNIIRMNFDEACLLWRSIKNTDGSILEIGRRHGGSTVLICAAAAGRSVVSVDIDPQHSPECDLFFDRLEDRANLELLTADSKMPFHDRTFGLLFIDGDHSYDGVRADTLAHWNALESHGGKPGLAVYHDAVPNDGLEYAGEMNHSPGVEKLCLELIESGAARKVDSAGSVLVLEKINQLPSEP